MPLNVSVFGKYFPPVLLFLMFKIFGKYTGTIAEGAGGPEKIKKYTAGGLMPPGRDRDRPGVDDSAETGVPYDFFRVYQYYSRRRGESRISRADTGNI